MATVRNAGIAISGSFQSMSSTCCIIKKPTKTSAVEAASDGTTSTSGEKNTDSKKKAPVNTVASPVRAPSPTPAEDSTYEVFEDVPARPPTAAAMESTSKIRSECGGMPFSSSRSPSAPIATMVPMVSKKSASSSEKMISTAAIGPSLENAPKKSIWPRVAKSGRRMGEPVRFGALSPHPVG